MKVAIITDTHWGARNDSQAFTNYFIKFYEEIFFPELLERNIDTVYLPNCEVDNLVSDINKLIETDSKD